MSLSGTINDVVIVGGGYAGVWAALGAARQFDQAGKKAARIVLITPEPFLTARPRLYEYRLAEHDAKLPLGPILGPPGVELVVGTAIRIEAAARRVHLADGAIIEGRALLLATGSRAMLPTQPGWAEQVEGVDNAEQSARLWRRLKRLEQQSPQVFVIGGGFTGIELAMELTAWRDAAAPGARIHLLDQGEIASGYSGPARQVILDALEKFSISLHPHTRITQVQDDRLVLIDGTSLACDIAVWAGGLLPNLIDVSVPIGQDPLGRWLVDERLMASEGVFAAGDVAAAPVEGGRRTTMSCQHALSSGVFAGHNAARFVLGLPALDYTPRPYVTCLDLGPAGAILTEGFERRLTLQGDAAKARKIVTNRKWIVPPIEGGRAALLAAAAPERWMTR